MSKEGLTGRNALVTGASKGLGRAMAVALAKQGAHLILVARDKEKLEAVAKEVVEAGSQADVFAADIAKEDQVLQLESDVSAKVGKVQILINNAGTNLRKNITDFTLDEWRGVQDTNVTSVFLMCRSFVPHMKGTGYGRILNMTSIMAHVSLPQRTESRVDTRFFGQVQLNINYLTFSKDAVQAGAEDAEAVADSGADEQ